MGKNLSSKRKFVDPSSFRLVVPPSPKALDVSASSYRQGRERASHVRCYYGATLTAREAGIAVKLCALEEKELSPQSIMVPPGILCLCAYSFPCLGYSCLTVPLHLHSHSHQLGKLFRVMLSIKATLVLPNSWP